MISNQDAPVKSNLPVIISGIVFWGMVFIGLGFTYYIINHEAEELATAYDKDIKIIQNSVQNTLEHHPGESLDKIETDLRSIIHLADNLVVKSIEVTDGSDFITLGPVDPRLQHKAQILEANGQKYTLTTYFTDINEIISTRRKNIITFVGIAVIIFGLILQKILQTLITTPVNRMIQTARRFSAGETEIRFDESRNDEFGYLARFINEALKSIIAQQTDLKFALQRAKLSEKELHGEKEKFQVTLESITDAVITADSTGNIQYMNHAAEHLLSVDLANIYGQPLNNFIHIIEENTDRFLDNPFYKSLKTEMPEKITGHAAIIVNDDEKIPVEITAAPMKNTQGTIIGGVMVLQNVSHTRTLTYQLKYAANHDSLTGLYNRRRFEEKLNNLIEEMEGGSEHTLLYIDLDQFKVVNDTSGHMAGDELLRQLSGVIKSELRHGDTLARLGGDEFGIILENCPLNIAQNIAEKIREKVKQFRFQWNESYFEIGSSIGLVKIDIANADIKEIMSAADLACYAAKDAGRNNVHIYKPTDEALSRKHGEMHWAASITTALKNNRFQLYKQLIKPIGNYEKDIEHWEILLRLENEDGEIISPEIFISAAERYQMMTDIDKWVINRIFSAMHEDKCCRTSRNVERVIAINLSGSSIGNSSILDFIITSAQKYNINMKEICFEITETAAVNNLADAIEFIGKLKNLGSKFSLDDFGSGLSSFNYLKSLPVDYLKIDGSFIKSMVPNAIDRAMVEAITRIGHIMDIPTIAEWVGDEETLRLISHIGVDFAQGHYIGRPMPLYPDNQ